ncbi:MAG: hypothetical protein MUC47_08830 [Candidatus Kapabacteria bacterium]|jgi:hypothetical protein|nr:hypothetical protein [Candidatus Kapabacteria bacterium]
MTKHSYSFFCLLLLASIVVGAQPRFSATMTPQPGTSESYVRGIPERFSPGPSGNNVIWDFANQPTIDPPRSIAVIRPDDLPAAIRQLFPQAAYAIVDDTTTYVFGASPVRIRMIGIVTPSSTTNLSDPNNSFDPRPVEFTSRQLFNDQFFGLFVKPAEGVSGRTSATATTTYDGYGTVVMPESIVNVGPLTDCMRIRQRISRSDQYTRQQQNITQQTITTRFQWYLPTRALPIIDFSVDSIVLFVNGRRTGQPIVERRLLFTNTTAVTTVAEAEELRLPYPLPAQSGGIVWLPTGGIGRHILYDALGNNVHEWLDPGPSLVLPPVSPGFYLLQIGAARFVPVPVAPYK